MSRATTFPPLSPNVYSMLDTLPDPLPSTCQLPLRGRSWAGGW